MSGRGPFQNDPLRGAGLLRWVIERPERIARLGVFILVASFVGVGVGLWATGRLDVEQVGYAGLFGISLLASGSIILPVPGLAALCIAVAPAMGLNPLAAGVVSALGQSLGEMTGYLAGATGAGLARRSRYYPRVRDWVRRRGIVVLFVLAVVPNPAFDLAGLAAGSLRYPVRRFLVVVFAGKLVKSVAVAYGCFYGAEWVASLI